MPDDRFQEFKGTLPYASELFGVYQPLLGWRGKQAQRRAYKEQLALAQEVLTRMLNDSRVHRLVKDHQRLTNEQVMLVSPDIALPPAIPAWLRGMAASHVQLTVEEFINSNKRVPTGYQEWSNVLDAASVRLHSMLNMHSPETAYRIVGTGLSNPGPQSAPLNESLVFGMLDYLSRNSPETLHTLFVESKKPWEIAKDYITSLEDFHSDVRSAVLSPVGIITLYREYFFEFKNFLGPPIEHVWISPGGSVEVFEVHTRRTILEKQLEAATEVTTRTEVTTTMQEELSDAVKEENQQNDKLGTTASGGANFAVWNAQGSTTYERDEAQSTAEETAHKTLRQQSEKLSNEIRRSFKTTFKTVLETEDQFSRRYVIQNTTEKLANYELRRKMRQVGVQVQHIGTQLCWQIYLDDPGKDLAIAKLVHVAKPEDLNAGVQPPEAPTPLAPKETPFTVNFAYEHTKGNDTEATYDSGRGNCHSPNLTNCDDEIVWFRDYVAPPPGIGYTLHAINVTPGPPVSPNDDPAIVSAHAEPRPPDAGGFRLYLDQVNFRDQPSINFKLNLIWNPRPISEEQQKAYNQQLAEFQERQRRDAHVQYVQLVRERIKLARGIRPRDEKDLREEERAVVSGRIIQNLMQITVDQTRQVAHVTAELIQQIFEVDKLLYFVAPYWWMPRSRRQSGPGPLLNPAAVTEPRRRAVELRTTQPADNEGGGAADVPNGEDGGSGNGGGSPSGPVEGRLNFRALDQTNVLTEDDLVDWDGLTPKERDHYLITEDSAPAPMGASLGWLLQLDGDKHRNAFLNSPWVKAVLPIRPGMEMAALDWLVQTHVEGTDGLDEALYDRGATLREQIRHLAQQIAEMNGDTLGSLATETVFETGFNPLEGGFRAPAPDGSAVEPGTAYAIFDQWIEVLPTNQVVAVEYKPEEHGAGNG